MRKGKATLLLTLPGHISLDGRDTLIETIRELAFPEPLGQRMVHVTWRADDLWLLRGVVTETLDALDDWFDRDDLIEAVAYEEEVGEDA